MLVNFTQDEHNSASPEKRNIVDSIYQYNRRFSGEPRQVLINSIIYIHLYKNLLICDRSVIISIYHDFNCRTMIYVEVENILHPHFAF